MNKMNHINRLGVGVLASAMIAAGAIGAGLSPVVALAANGTVTIAQKDNKIEPYTYDAFQIFGADVVKDGSDYKATHLTWASPAAKAAVIQFVGGLDDDGNHAVDYEEWLAVKYNKPIGQISVDHRESAQNLAEYLASKIDESAAATGTSTDPETKQGDSFAARLSRSLYAAGLTSTPITQGQATELAQGYWLITSTPEAIANGEAGAAPMWAAVSSSALTITEKTDVPTIDKTVKGDDADENSFQKIADAGVGEAANVDFKIASVLPTNIDSFASYRVSVADTLPSGMALKDGDTSSVKVELAGVDITDDLNGEYGSITYVGNVLTVAINNVKDAEHLSDADVLTDKNFVITYEAHLTGTAAIGADGNDNKAVLTYDADPNNPDITKTIESQAKVVTYQVKLNKLDKATRLPLEGAKFTCQTEIGGKTYYVKEDGTLTENEAEAFKFTTNSNGEVIVPRLDEGTYVLKETDAPADYEKIDTDITLTLDGTKDGQAGTLTALSATVNGGEGFTAGIVDAQVADGITSATVATGEVAFAVSDDLIIKLPLTGMPVKTAALYGGIAIAIASVVAYGVSKRNKEEE